MGEIEKKCNTCKHQHDEMLICTKNPTKCFPHAGSGYLLWEARFPEDSLAYAQLRPNQFVHDATGEEVENYGSAAIHIKREVQVLNDVQISASGFLHKAANIMEERGKTYDSPKGERSMGKAVEAFNAITSHSLSESEGWLLLQLLKDVRQWSRDGYHGDSAEDCIAYAALKAESLQNGD